MEFNGVMMQYFHWYLEPDGKLWKQVKKEAKDLAKKGVTSLWLPPATKGAGGGFDVGYGIYDLFDLGEFDQKGSLRTKYGTKDEYVAAIEAANKVGMRIYADVVFNHKLGADAKEEAMAKPFNPENRNEALGDYQKIKAWTHFKFEGRTVSKKQGSKGKGKHYSDMEWHWQHFTAIDHNDYADSGGAIYLFEGAGWGDEVDLEKGNFDYLMGCDVNVDHPEVMGELEHWGKWYVETTGVSGFRFDALKHVSADFFKDWLGKVQHETDKDLFAVGEYWSYEVNALQNFINKTEGKIALFDAPLHHKLHRAGSMGNNFDMRTVFDGTLVKQQPILAVTLVENHDTQPLQSLEAVVEPWFKPLAYALILLRKDGYPCIFYADYYGTTYTDKGKDGQEYEIHMPSHKFIIDVFLQTRQDYAFGEQYDYFDHPNCVGWTRVGNEDHPEGMAVLLSNSEAGYKWMETTKANTHYIDVTGHLEQTITTNEHGWAEFHCPAGSLSVWVPKKD